LTGGIPNLLGELYSAKWSIEALLSRLVMEKRPAADFAARRRGWLKHAVEDPDALRGRGAPEKLVNELERRNLVMHFLPDRITQLWIDQQPPEKDLETGIGRRVARQTPLRREAAEKPKTPNGPHPTTAEPA
jgi:hypothetical protein